MSRAAVRRLPTWAAVAVLAAIVASACTTDSPPRAEPSELASPTPDRSSPTAEPAPSTTTSSPTPDAVSEPPAPPTFDAAEALAVTRYLANEIGVRASGTAADEATRDYLAEQLRSHGWRVDEMPFELPQGGTSANVIATWGDRGREDGPVVIIGAHQDTKPDTVGANDNATGCGVLVALAGALSSVAADLPIPVMLVAFGAEEFQQDTGVHHIGSEHLATDVADRTVAMLAIDMVGNGPSTRVMRLEGAPATLQERLLSVAEAEAIADVVADAGGDISDHGPFARRGVPAAFLWTGDDGRLHTPEDTFEHVDVGDLERAGDLTLAWLLGLTAEDAEGLELSAG